MDKPLPFDELNIIREIVRADFSLPAEERKRKKGDRIDEILELLILAYLNGNEAANDMIGSSEDVTEAGLQSSVFRKVAGKTFEQRVSEYYEAENGTASDVIRVIETDTTRVYNDAILNVGEKQSTPNSPVKKQWQTMMDDRVRDQHQYLEGMTVPINGRFYTYDGDSARYPGDFALAENNVNCRCRIVLKK